MAEKECAALRLADDVIYSGESMFRGCEAGGVIVRNSVDW